MEYAAESSVKPEAQERRSQCDRAWWGSLHHPRDAAGLWCDTSVQRLRL